MKSWVVATISFHENNLNLNIVSNKDTWFEALTEVVGYPLYLDSSDLDKSKSMAFDQDWLFDVKEI